MNEMNENKRITDGNYDKSLAVKCNNGTFVGKKTDELVIWKGIPYATKPGHVPVWPMNDSFGTAEFGEDLMMSWAERLGNGSSKRVC